MDTPARPLTTDVADADRYQPYRKVHKGLRLAMSDCLRCVASADADDLTSVLFAISQVADVLDLCAHHLGHENAFMHAALRERAPESVQAFDHDHACQVAAERALRGTLDALRSASGDAADRLLYRLYLELSANFAEQWRHMAEEETSLTLAFWAHFSDSEIRQIEARLVAAIEPGTRAVMSDWMLQALNHAERVELLSAMRESMPAAAFDALLERLQGRLSASASMRLRRAFPLAVDSAAG